jgi:hypothetical protein
VAGCFAAARFEFFAVDGQLATVLIVVENNLFQAVVVEIVVPLLAVSRLVATGTARAAATSTAASFPTFTPFFRLARFVTRILAIDRRFGRRFVTAAFAFFAATSPAAAATSAPPTSRPVTFSFAGAFGSLLGIAAAVLHRKLDRLRLPRLAHGDGLVIEFAARLIPPVATILLDIRFRFQIRGTRALGDLVRLLIRCAEDLVPQAHAEAGRRHRFGRCRLNRCGSGGDFFYRLFRPQCFLFFTRPSAAILPGPFLAGAVFTWTILTGPFFTRPILAGAVFAGPIVPPAAFARTPTAATAWRTVFAAWLLAARFFARWLLLTWGAFPPRTSLAAAAGPFLGRSFRTFPTWRRLGARRFDSGLLHARSFDRHWLGRRRGNFQTQVGREIRPALRRRLLPRGRLGRFARPFFRGRDFGVNRFWRCRLRRSVRA